MSRFNEIFRLWLGISIASALASFAWSWFRGGNGLYSIVLFPIAWNLQIPLVAFLAVAHYSMDRLAGLLPARTSRWLSGSITYLMVFFWLLFQISSHRLHDRIDCFLSYESLRMAFRNGRQIAPDILRGGKGAIMAAGFAALGVLWIHQRFPRRRGKSVPGPAEGKSRIMYVGLGLLFVAAVMLARFGQLDDEGALENDCLPTTFFAYGIVEDLAGGLLHGSPQVVELDLKPRISLETYCSGVQRIPVTNVFTILLESLSWDHLGVTGYSKKGITPNIDELAGDCLIFPKTYAAANHSAYSQTSMHASQYPLRKNRLDNFDRIDYPRTLLFDILPRFGYKTAFISAQNEDWGGMRHFIQSSSEFDLYFHSKDALGDRITIESKVDDRVVIDRALQFLDLTAGKAPVIMYLNLQRTHFPYDLAPGSPKPYQPCGTDGFEFDFSAYDKNHIDRVIDKYDNALHYVDGQVGRFVNGLKARGLYENSLIVLSADHGEAFYKHGFPTHASSLFEDQVRVSTFFKLPGASKRGVREDAISLIDLNPTVLEILGLPNHPNFQGQQVLAGSRSGYIHLLSHGFSRCSGIVDYPWKYVERNGDRRRLANLELDPDESRDFSSQNPGKLAELRAAMGSYTSRQLYYYTGLSREKRNRFYPPSP